ncbi:hypothetical protein TSAR_001201 [Trichomalopsis sarcophagae]|uniref:Uncharacterized protein n=1 Tax=Trichomalopsis sarcophagae TaxID=543379 RepID=A0A232EIM7_9HYME|nr:hypothetical protein TSAR_001201 [Trichomalopsis sarcophagae]
MNLLLRYGAEFYPRRSYMRYITDRRPPGSTSQFIVYCLAREISEKRFSKIVTGRYHPFPQYTMSTYQKKLRMIGMSIPYGDQQETLRLIKSLAPTMLPTKMTMIIHQCILGDKIKIIEYSLDNLYEQRLLRHCSWEGTNLVHLVVESGSLKAVETTLSREINDINGIDGNGYGAEFYPRRSYMRYITDRRPPGSTSQFIVYCLAREISEKRFVNSDDLRALKIYHPEDLMENPIKNFYNVDPPFLEDRKRGTNKEGPVMEITKMLAYLGGIPNHQAKKNKLLQGDRILTRSSYLEKSVNIVKPDRNNCKDFVDKYIRVLIGETPSQVLELNALLWQFDIDLTYQRGMDLFNQDIITRDERILQFLLDAGIKPENDLCPYIVAITSQFSNYNG